MMGAKRRRTKEAKGSDLVVTNVEEERKKEMDAKVGDRETLNDDVVFRSFLLFFHGVSSTRRSSSLFFSSSSFIDRKA